jgi:hypothetical protein
VGSVYTLSSGRLAKQAAQDRLARQLVFIGEAVRPALDLKVLRVDVTLPAPVLIRVPDTAGDFAEIGDVRVVGTELTLTDFRRDEHRFAFTFIRSISRDHLKLPDMTGTLVTIEDEEECRRYVSPRIQSASCYLADHSTQLLRYDLELEYDLIMAYVRQFFMPGLQYWRYRALGHSLEYRHWASEIRDRPPRERRIRHAIERWVEMTKWPPITEWHPCVLDDELRHRFEAEGTVEAIATGALIALLRRAHRERLD